MAQAVTVTVGATLAASFTTTFRGANSAVTALTSKVGALSSALGKLNTATATIARTGARLGTVFTSATSSASAASAAVGGMSRSTGTLEKRLKALEAAYQRATAAATALSHVPPPIPPALPPRGGGGGGGGRGSAGTPMSSALSGFGGSLAAGGTIVGAAGLGLIYGEKALLEGGYGLDKEMAKFRAHSGMSDPANEEMKAFFIKLGVDTEHTIEDAAKAGTILAKSSVGITPQDVKSILPTVLAGATIGDTTVPATMTAMLDSMHAFGLGTEKAAHLLDVMVYASTHTTASLEDLHSTLKYAAPIAKEVGISMEDTIGITAALASAGIKGSQGGTGIRRLLQRVVDQKDMLQGLGVSVGEKGADGVTRVRPLAKIVGDLGRVLGGMSNQVEAKGISDSIFGVYGSTAASVLFNQARTGQLTKVLDGSNTVAPGYSVGIQQAYLRSVDGQMKLLSSSVDALKTVLAEALKPVLMSILPVVTDIVGAVAGWVSRHPALTRAILVGVAALGAFLAVAGAVVGVIGSAIAIVGGAIAGWAALEVVLTIAGTTLGGVAAAIGAVALEFLPVIAIAAAVAGAVWLFWNPLKAFFEGFGSGIAEGLAPVFDAFGEMLDALVPVGEVIMEMLSPLFDANEEWKTMASLGKMAGQVIGYAMRAVLAPIELVVRGITKITDFITGDSSESRANRRKQDEALAVTSFNTDKKLMERLGFFKGGEFVSSALPKLEGAVGDSRSVFSSSFLKEMARGQSLAPTADKLSQSSNATLQRLIELAVAREGGSASSGGGSVTRNLNVTNNISSPVPAESAAQVHRRLLDDEARVRQSERGTMSDGFITPGVR